MTAHTARFDAPYEERPRRRGLFSDWLGGGRSDAGYLRQEPEREFTARHAPEEPVRILADGDAFQFRVYPTFEWRGLAQSRDDLVAATSPLMGRARRTLANVLRPMSSTRTRQDRRTSPDRRPASRRSAGADPPAGVPRTDWSLLPVGRPEPEHRVEVRDLVDVPAGQQRDGHLVGHALFLPGCRARRPGSDPRWRTPPEVDTVLCIVMRRLVWESGSRSPGRAATPAASCCA